MNNSHTTGETWVEFLVAAENKIRAARYHKGILKGEVLDLESRHVNQPTDKLQAHFEGVLYSYLAAIDQTRKVMMKGFKLRFDRPEPCPTCRKSPRVSDRFEDVVAKVPDSDLRQKLLDWHDQPILKDARNIRN